MIVHMNTRKVQTIEQVRAFLLGSERFSLKAGDRAESHRWMSETLQGFHYVRSCRADKGILKSYLERVTGLSRAQVARRIAQFVAQGTIKDQRRLPARAFERRYTAEDIRLLAQMDGWHQSPSGTTLRKLCERAFRVHGDLRFERLAGISNGHLYNLRQHATYQSKRQVFNKTQASPVRIGERRKPRPNGRPGYLRVDSVHQGDFEGIKGIYLINAVDEVTQFQMICAVERISEAHLIPALQALLEAFPFVVRGFHSDNGSEYINHQVAQLLDKLHIEQTKSRSRQTNDNALAESKNASTVRKYLGYSHIPQRFASQVNALTVEVLAPYLNYHRPCHFPSEVENKKGKIKKRYRYQDMQTPYEKFRALPEVESFLKPGMSLKKLDAIAHECSDNDAAQRLQKARDKLFLSIYKTQRHAA